MAAVSACPDRHVLQQLALGHLPSDEVDRLAEHIEHCAACVKVLDAVRSSDTVIDAMQASSVVEKPDPRVSELIEQLRRKPPSPDATAALQASSAASVVSSGARTEFGEESYDFLAPAAGPEEIGRLGGYRILKVLGAGGMGVVFLAEDLQLKRVIALKTMKPSVALNPQSRERFIREAQASAMLENDHIVPIYQVGEDRGVPFLAMPFLKGSSLEDRLKKSGKLNTEQVVRLGMQIARGLAVAHERGLIHRDIKPANIWIEPDNGGRAKLLDFGLARGLSGDSHLTQSGTIVGTPAYMAPEQARGEKVDARCDLFSLGCVLYRMTTGVQPFQGAETMATLIALALHNPEPPQKVNPAVPTALSELVMRLIAKDPTGRPASAKAVIEELQGIERQLRKPSAEETVSQPKPAAVRFSPRQKVLVGLAAAVVAVLAGVIVLKITRKDGKVEEIELKPGDKIEIVEKDKKDKDDKKPDKGPAVATLDKLDAAKIPAEERFPWQPKELVAVIGEHRGRHWGSVNRIRISADGRTVASVGDHIRLWDAKTLREQGVIPMQGVTDAAFSPKDGTLVCMGLMPGGAGQVIAMWDVSGAAPKLRGQAATLANVSCVAYAPDGATLAGGCKDGTVRLWDVSGETPKEKAVHKGHTAGIQMVDFSPDGKSLASCSRGSQDKSVRIWDLAADKPKEPIVFTSHVEGLAGLRFAPDGKTLATADEDHSVRLWDLTGAKPREKALLRDSTCELAFTPDGKTLVCRSPHSGQVRIMDVAGALPRERSVIKVGTGIFGFALAPDGKSLVTTGGSQTCLLQWDLTEDQPQQRLEPQGHTGPLVGPVLAPDGKSLTTYAQQDRVVRLWDVSGTAPRQRAELRHTFPVHSICYSPDNKTLASGSYDTVRLWDLTAVEPEERITFKPGGKSQIIAFAPDGKTLACYAAQGGTTIRLWDVSGAEPKELAILPNCRGPVAFAPDGKTLACYRLPEKENLYHLLLWDLSGVEPKERAQINVKEGPLIPDGGIMRMGVQHPGPTTWAPDGKTLAIKGVASTTPCVLLWDMKGTKPKELAVIAMTYTAAFAPDGKTLACPTLLGIGLWDVAKRKQLRNWQLPGSVNDAVFTQDGRHLITANANGTAYVLRLQTTEGK